MKNLLKITFTLIFTTILLLGFALPLNPAGNWYQQFMPNIGSQQINDIIFLDSLNGFAIASRNVFPDTSSILRTTNSGYSWQVIQTLTPRRYSRIKFVNNLTGFISGGSGSGTPYLYKSIDGGNTWNIVPGATLGNALWGDMAVISVDTIWLTDANSLNGGVFRTTNGGVNWQQQLNLGSLNPEKIYMYNQRIGYISRNEGSAGYVRKTTDGGNTWSLIVSNDYYLNINFADSLTGWRSSVFGFKKTTNGGINWINQVLPTGGIIFNSAIGSLSILNKDTLLGTGGGVMYPNGQFRGIIYRTTDGGNNWLFQVPDSVIHTAGYTSIKFINKNNGWLYNFTLLTGIHTTTGGDPVWITGIEQISTEVPQEFNLYQNYPNPFNPSTKINFEISLSRGVTGEAGRGVLTLLMIYNSLGQEVTTLVNQQLSPGTYSVEWNASNYPSGIYFCRLTSGVFSAVNKMILVK